MTKVVKKKHYMYVVYNGDYTRGPPGKALMVWSVPLSIAPVQWAAPYGEDLAAGEAWSKYPRFW